MTAAVTRVLYIYGGGAGVDVGDGHIPWRRRGQRVAMWVGIYTIQCLEVCVCVRKRKSVCI